MMLMPKSMMLPSTHCPSRGITPTSDVMFFSCQRLYPVLSWISAAMCLSGSTTDSGARAMSCTWLTTIQTIRLIGTRKHSTASPSSSDAARLRRHLRQAVR